MQSLISDKSKTAVLVMDYQKEIVAGYAEGQQKPLLQSARLVLEAARQVRLPVIYVVVRLRDGYPEVNPRNKTFSRVKESRRFREGTAGAEVHADVAPQPSEIVVTKRRVGAFSTTDLETVLRAKEINALVLLGLSTSGVVLSTVRWAADMDYELVVISDGKVFQMMPRALLSGGLLKRI